MMRQDDDVLNVSNNTKNSDKQAHPPHNDAQYELMKNAHGTKHQAAMNSPMPMLPFAACNVDAFNDSNYESGSSDDFDETQPHEEIFYVFPDVTSYQDTEMETGDKYRREQDLVQAQTPVGVRNERSGSLDFQALASKALQSLEKDYHQTVKFDHSASAVSDSHENAYSGMDYGNISSTGTQTESNDENQASYLASGSSLKVPESHNDDCIGIESENSKAKVDSSTIAKVIERIKLQSGAALDLKLSLWKPRHRECAPLTIGEGHVIIPKKPFLAFKRQTAKAQTASANLTRSATIAEAIKRLFLPECRQANEEMLQRYWHVEDEVFVIHCIGADLVECQSIRTITRAMAPFVKWFHQYDDPRDHDFLLWPSHLKIELLGPCVPMQATQFGSLNLIPKDEYGKAVPGRLISATVRCRNCLYHDHLAELENKSSRQFLNERHDTAGWSDFENSRVSIESTEYPNLVIAFNAGIWGYDSWIPTLRKLHRFSRSVPFVITAYTLPEAEDDEHAFYQALALKMDEEKRCFWSPEINPFSSRTVRETKSSDNIYFENGAWQAILMGDLKTNVTEVSHSNPNNDR